MDEDLQKLLHDLNIDNGVSILQEYQFAKKSLKEGNQVGPDNITLEILKRCDREDIILSFEIEYETQSMVQD